MQRVSIVLPVYNEADRLAACLQAIAAQTVQTYEVIVVDNNSTDNTARVAQSFPFVRVLRETRQGVVYARSRGFDAARGEIIARIDADTLIPKDWVARALDIMSTSELAAVSGAVTYHDMPARHVIARIDLVFRRRVARLLKNEVFLQAANMAMRREAWVAVRSSLCQRSGLHEDFDLAIHLQKLGYVVAFRPDLKADISARCLNDSVKSFYNYAMLNPGTYAQHGLKSRRHLYPLVLLAIVVQVPLRALYRAYDSKNQQFIWRDAFWSSMKRINPATFAD